MFLLFCSDHYFDLPDRKSNSKKRKRGTINDLSKPARGAVGVRSERYRLNESKILAHIRAGKELPDSFTTSTLMLYRSCISCHLVVMLLHVPVIARSPFIGFPTYIAPVHCIAMHTTNMSI